MVMLNSYDTEELVETFDVHTEPKSWLFMDAPFEVSDALFVRYCIICQEKLSLERMFRDVRKAPTPRTVGDLIRAEINRVDHQPQE